MSAADLTGFTTLAQAQELVQREFAQTSSKIERLKRQYGVVVDAYRGAIPASYAFLHMLIESRGNPNSLGEASLGERGIFQNTAGDAQRAGVQPGQLTNPEIASFVFSTTTIKKALSLQRKYPTLFPSRSQTDMEDLWACSRVVFMVGEGTFQSLVAGANPRSGPVLLALQRHIEANPATVARGQSGTIGSETMRRRILYRGEEMRFHINKSSDAEVVVLSLPPAPSFNRTYC